MIDGCFPRKPPIYPVLSEKSNALQWSELAAVWAS